jgi:mono/diheme cytochrome c family protein
MMVGGEAANHHHNRIFREILAMRPIIFTIVLFALAACSAAAAAPDQIALGKRMFTIQCGGCHPVVDVGPDTLAPRLDTIMIRARRAADPAAWLRQAIIDPNASVAPGYQPGLMPVGFRDTLTPEQLDALVAYMLSMDKQK